LIEKGTPLRQGEIDIKFVLFDPNAKGRQIELLFKLPLPGKLTVAEAKVEVVKYFEQLQTDEKTKRKDGFTLGKPENLRFRELIMQSPSKIYTDKERLADVTRSSYIIPEIAVQKLPEDVTETKTSSKDKFIFLQQFFPQTFSLGPRFEFQTNDDERLSVFRDRICDLAEIDSLGVVSGEHWNTGAKLLLIPKLSWTVTRKGELSKSQPEREDDDDAYFQTYDPTRPVSSLSLSDGTLLLFRDMKDPLKVLTEADEKGIKED